MAFRTFLIGAAALAVAGGGVALAQSPFPPVGQESPFPPVGQQAPAQQKPPCIDQFLPLRQEVEKQFAIARAALEKRAAAPELCRLLTRFTNSEIKMIKFVEQNGAWCNFPPNALPDMRASHSKSQGYRKQACDAAASAVRPRAVEPSLSDLLSPPVTDKDTTRTGRGTLDSLGGNPIGR